ncbi:MAG: PA2169 family four-helix-bundle protein [Caloramator sp.]|nr:PA2169 family four-helix-bundle protein [Caloramator sp.]
MDKNIELLNYIHQNAQMGIETLKQLIKETKDENMKNVLQRHLNEYQKFYDMTDSKLKSKNIEPKELNFLSKTFTDLMINLKTLRDKSPSHMAEMLIQGSTMGIVDMTKKIKEYQGVEKETLDIANGLLQFEQKSVDEYKGFL